MRWLPIAVLVVGLTAAAWMLLQVDRREGEDQREPVSVIEHTAPAPAATGFTAASSDAVPQLDMLPAGEGMPRPLFAERAEAPAWAPAGAFAGRVVDSAGRPTAAAKLSLIEGVEPKNFWFGFDLPPPLAVAASAADGTFLMSRVPAGKTLMLRIDAPGGKLLMRHGLVALPNQTLDLGDVRLLDGARLLGLVTDDEGHDVPGAEVILGTRASLFEEMARRRSCDSAPEITDSAVRIVRTGAGGDFEFDAVPPLSGKLAVYARGFAPWNGESSPIAGESRVIEVQLDRGLRIAGRTVDERGQPVPGANVTAIEEGSELVLSCSPSDEAGRFELLDLAPKEHSLSAVVRGLAKSDVLQVKPAADDVVLTLTPLSTSTLIAVEVVDESGAPASGFQLWTAFAESAFCYGSYAEVPAEGIIQFHWRVGLRGWLWADAPGRVSLAARLQPGSANAPIRLQLQAAVPVEGRVVDADTRAGLPGAELHVTILGDIVPDEDRTWADADGRFRLEGLPYGDVTLRAWAEGHAEQTVRLREDQARAVDIPLVAAGTVLIQASPAWCRDVGARVDVKLCTQARDGRQEREGGQLPWVLPQLAPGRYEVWVETHAQTPTLTSQHLELDVAATGVTPVDLSALTLRP